MVDKYDFPDGVYYAESGLEQQMEDAFSDLLLALIVAILLVYIVLAAQFESFILPVMVMMSIPFAMSGACLLYTSQLGLAVIITAGVTNMVLDYVFVGVLHWGVAGAAAATAVSETRCV